ncbi:MAG: hypothetical protein ABEJ95_06260 [Candidatus Nanohalobium sp.]
MEEAFPVVAVIGLAIFGIFWIGSQADGEFSFGSDQPESMLLYSEQPGTIGSSNEDFRTVNFGDFTVGEIRGDIQVYTSEKETVSNGLLSSEKITIEYNATQPGQGQVSFEVLGRKEKGQIYVKVNDRQVFKAATISGATPKINISRENLHTGINTIEIGTTQSSILGKSVYTLEDIEVTVKDRKFHDHTTYFQMYDHELNHFRPSNLTFNIPLDQSIPQEPLKITVNNREVFKQRTGRSTQETTITPQNADLHTGYNTIEFGTDGESKYRVENAELQLRYSVNVEPAQKTYSFNLNQERLDYTKKSNTEEKLQFNYQTGTKPAPVKIQLNNAYYTVKPENGLKTVKIGEEAIQKENTLTISSNQTFTMENLQLTSERTG